MPSRYMNQHRSDSSYPIYRIGHPMILGLVISVPFAVRAQANWLVQEQAAATQQAAAPVSPDDVVRDSLTLEKIESRRAAVEAAPGITDEKKAQFNQQLDRAAGFINDRINLEQRTAARRAEIESGPDEIAAARQQLEKPSMPVKIQVPADTSVSELEQLRLADQEQLADVSKRLETWDTRAKNRLERRPQMPTLIESARAELEEAREQVTARTSQEEDEPLENLVARTEQTALLELRQAELESLRVEQARYEALTELFPLQRDVLTRDRNSLERRMEQWNKVLAQARQKEVERQEREAARRLEEAHPELRELAERNAELTQERTAIQESLNRWNSELSEFSRKLKNIEDSFEGIRVKEEVVGLTTPIGLELRSDRANLPNRRQFQRRLRSAEEQIRDLHSSRFKLDAERRKLADIESAFQEVVDSLSEIAQEDEFLLSTARSYLTKQREYLSSLLTDHQTALDTLGKIDSVCRSLLKQIDEYQQFIDQRVLWIRSVSPISLSTPSEFFDAVAEIMETREPETLIQFFTQDVREFLAIYLLFAFVLALLLLLERRYRHVLERLHENSRGPLQTGMVEHLFSLLLTLIVVLPAPWVIGFLGIRMLRAESLWIASIGQGLWITAFHLWILNTFLRLFMPKGFAARFLQWPDNILQRLRASLKLYRYLGIPLVLVFVTISRLENPIYAATIGRLAFVLECALLLVILQRILRPTGPVFVELVKSNPHSRVFQLRWLWYSLSSILPIYLAALSLFGFQYTAVQLMIRFQWTIVLAGSLAVLYALACTWIVASRRKLAIRQAQLRREAEFAARQETEQAEEAGVSAATLKAEAEMVDLSQVNRQGLQFVSGVTLLLFFVGCWAIWAQVLPALQVFSNHEVWSTMKTSTSLVTAEGGETRSVEVTSIVPTTVGHLLAAIVIFSVALFAGRNLPSLLELFVLQRLPIDKGSRDAMKLATGYALVIGGLIIGSNIVGLQWSNIQWLAAALTVGLGFGLQEIFANFVAGVIILFERPVRIGDIVTIDNVSGSVTRIQIRATTITDWDRKEYIVPNKEFVTGKLLNWTLTDRTNRILIEVGVAYGTDVQKALDLLQRIGEEHPQILKDPAPSVSFDRFADSTLDLSLRCFLPTFDGRLKVITELHSEIAKRFHETNIEIAFPQRDLHLRSLPQELTALMEKK